MKTTHGQRFGGGWFRAGWIGAMLFLAAVMNGCGASAEREGEEAEAPASGNFDVLRAFEREMDDMLAREVYRRARSRNVEELLEGGKVEGATVRHPELLKALYEPRSFRPIWYRDFDGEYGPKAAAFKLRDGLIEAVRSHGMWPEAVHLAKVRPLGETAGGCCGSLDLRLTDEQRQAILTYLAERKQDLEVTEDLRWLGKLVSHASGPTPEIADKVGRRVDHLADRLRRVARREVLLSDGLAEYLDEMRYGNPVWHQPRAWRATLRIGERGPVRSTTIAGKEKEKTAAETMRRAIRRARTKTMLLEAMRQVADDPGTIETKMQEVVPPIRQYRRLAEAFHRYRPIVERGGWPEVPASAEGLTVGQVSRDVRVLKERLRLEGYWQPSSTENRRTNLTSAATAATASKEVVQDRADAGLRAPLSGDEEGYTMVYDRRLKEAVVTYQETHQLWEHDSLTAQTIRSLNVPARRRWNQLRLALQRWRESNIGADRHYIHVNIPDFHAEVWHDDQRVMRFRVIVGQSTRKEDEKTERVRWPHATPTFSDSLEYMVLNPYWNVPESIRKNELKPKLEENSDYYEEEGFEVVVDDNGHEFVRQKPGPKNALGKVKFLFPNEYSVYMHDTPAKSLFSKPMRAYSHGCVRVEEPKKLMHYLLDLDGRWSGKRRKELLEKWFDSDQEKWLSLRHPLPVHIEYYVVRVDDNGRANFLSDLYDLDKPRMAKIDERLASYADGYDLPVPTLTEMMEAALKGTLHAPAVR